jgi:PAS domain-containing protein
MTMKPDYRILYLEDREEEVARVADFLRQAYLPIDVSWVKGWKAFENALEGGWGFDLLFLADGLPGVRTETALALARRRWPDLPLFVMCGPGSEAKAVEYLHQGATECLVLEPGQTCLPRLAPMVRRALKEARIQTELREAEAAKAKLAAMLRSIMESTAEGILVADLAGKITVYNRKFLSLCGIPEYVMAPMQLEEVLQFLQDQFTDPEAFLREARNLEAHPELGHIELQRPRNQSSLELGIRPQQIGNETLGRVFSIRERAPSPRPAGVPQDLLEAAKAGLVVPWYLTEDDLVISEKGLQVLALAPGGLPTELRGLEAMIHPDDLDQFRQGLERPQPEAVELRMRRPDQSWVRTLWNIKRSQGGYRGVFRETTAPPRPGPLDDECSDDPLPGAEMKPRIMRG